PDEQARVDAERVAEVLARRVEAVGEPERVLPSDAVRAALRAASRLLPAPPPPQAVSATAATAATSTTPIRELIEFNMTRGYPAVCPKNLVRAKREDRLRNPDAARTRRRGPTATRARAASPR